MGKTPKTLQEIERDVLALEPPRMTVLSDRPLRARDAHLDSLGLAVKLGPMFDILRHPDTRTPLAMAIYGDWGSGKTSAMKWLEGLLNEWNRHGLREGDDGKSVGKVVRPVWFYPWKYHDRRDVWRGLIAEVILASIDIRGASGGRVKKAFKQFGAFLGRSFMHVLTRMKLVDGADVLDDIVAEYRTAAHPEAGYLNEFETTLRSWVRETISEPGERMVVFIDDLDRCLPEVALEVLEALKLYLNIEDLVFVVGVDRSVVDQLIQKLYARHGLESDKSKNYLAKMFQVEVVIGPNERQAESFLDDQVDAIGARTNEYWHTQLSDEQRNTFREVVLSLAERNPREIKRLLNSVLIHGAGVLHVENRPFSFAQGMQTFLVRQLLDERYTMGLTVDTRTGMQFFHSWSRIVRSGAPAFLAHPEELARRLGSDADELESPYAELLSEPRFAHLLALLADRELGILMRIEYPADTTALTETSRQQLPDGLISEAIARQLDKHPSRLQPDDYRRITHFDISDEISDITSLRLFTELQDVDLSFTHVDDIRPLANASKLVSLSLTKTMVSDIAPLRALRQLRELSLADTKVDDVSALATLLQLESINLRNTTVSDAGPLAELSNLQTLSLNATRVSDLRPLVGLISLRLLDLRNCPVDRESVDELRRALPNTQILAD